MQGAGAVFDPDPNLRFVIMRDDVFAQLKLPVDVVENDLLGDIYSDLSANAPDDWMSPASWTAIEVQHESQAVQTVLEPQRSFGWIEND